MVLLKVIHNLSEPVDGAWPAVDLSLISIVN